MKLKVYQKSFEAKAAFPKSYYFEAKSFPLTSTDLLCLSEHGLPFNREGDGMIRDKVYIFNSNPVKHVVDQWESLNCVSLF